MAISHVTIMDEHEANALEVLSRNAQFVALRIDGNARTVKIKDLFGAVQLLQGAYYDDHPDEVPGGFARNNEEV